jgi:hypothetical protein
MPTGRSLTLRLESHPDDQPIAGWICDERGQEQYFAGWLGLLTLLEQARLMATDAPQQSARHAGAGNRETRNQ